MKTVKTPKGTDLPLINLKGKDYLQVAHRLIWFNEVSSNFTINTELLLVTDDQTVARAQIQVLGPNGEVIKQASATKRETKKDFSDHTEKAETGAIGRALALMGYGTQFAIADLDEGDRLADSPVVNTKSTTDTVNAAVAEAKKEHEAKKTSFRKPSAPAPVADSGWDT
jgi:hypothetical protein